MSSGRGSKAASGKNPVLRFVLFAACSACGLVAFLLVYATKLHHEDAARVTGPASVGAPVLSAPGAKRPPAPRSSRQERPPPRLRPPLGPELAGAAGGRRRARCQPERWTLPQPRRARGQRAVYVRRYHSRGRRRRVPADREPLGHRDALEPRRHRPRAGPVSRDAPVLQLQ